jgi:uncharacterized protein (DUF1697 family)
VRKVVLLRGINLGARNRVAMPALRELLAEAGFADVETYLQSGNVVLCSGRSPARLAKECERQIEEGFGLQIPVIVRTGEELAEIVRRDPLGKLASEPKRYEVTFCATKPDAKVVRELEAKASGSERVEAIGRELYAWHPAGVGRSKLALALAGKGLGVSATARNWTTVTKLLELAER